MALIHCKECGNEVNSEENTCSHCGEKLKDNKRLFEAIQSIIKIILRFT